MFFDLFFSLMIWFFCGFWLFRCVRCFRWDFVDFSFILFLVRVVFYVRFGCMVCFFSFIELRVEIIVGVFWIVFCSAVW